MCSTRRVPVTHLSTTKARIDVTLAGVSFSRSKSDAARRGTTRRVDLDWEDVTGAAIHTTNGGRAVIRVGVTDAPVALHHRDDPHTIKVKRDQSDVAHELVAQINHEVAVRRRWRENAEIADNG